MDRKTGVQHHHQPLPFGAELEADGGVCFRLFGPAVESVALLIEGREPLPMQTDGHGWHTLHVAEAGAGIRYRYRLPNGLAVPDPISRFQPEDIDGPSEVIDACAYPWNSDGWTGRPWSEAVLYELHVGTFTQTGTLQAAIERLPALKELGVTAIELMALSDFAGLWNWGYDGVLLYAPDSAYGRPEDLKAFVDAAHGLGLMVILDVVYNHFGPEGNYLSQYFPQVFSNEHKTAWGPALNFDGECSHEVRELVIQNALYWLLEYQMDGLRLDATHDMIDRGPRHILDELAERVAEATEGRQVHLILENENNIARRLTRSADGRSECYTAQWNHDVDHLLGAGFMGTFDDRQQDDKGETDRLGKALAEGFVIAAQEHHEEYEAGCHVPPNAFVSFLQSHDLVGNRVLGERVTSLLPRETVRALVTVALLLPQTPMLFMGEEWGATSPFPYFCDFHGELGAAVQKGRREEIAKLPSVSEEDLQKAPNCQAESTFRSAQLHWEERAEPGHAAWLELYKGLLQTRRERLVPRMQALSSRCGSYRVLEPGGLSVMWTLQDGCAVQMDANLWHKARGGFPKPQAEVLWMEGEMRPEGELGPWTVRWSISGEGCER